MAWTFAQQNPMAKHRDPIQGEFFSTESISSVADSVVRESIQNSMDAKFRDEAPNVRVEFSIVTISKSQADRLFADLWPHLKACDPRFVQLRDTKKVTCLLVEDYGTTGLRGDPHEMYEADEAEDRDPPNEFYYFVRAEGRSSKTGGDRGSWGIGKYTYTMVSQIHSVLAYTVRGPRCGPGGKGPLAMGLSVLRNHKVGDRRFQPDGWWSAFQRLPEEAQECPVPFEADSHEVALLVDTFGIQRGKRPGLSIIVPYVDEELTADEVRTSVIKNYGLAIGWGHLEVVVRDGDTSTKITSVSLDRVIDELPTVDQAQIRGDLDLARWGVGLDEEKRVAIGKVEDRPSWTGSGLMSEEAATEISRGLAEDGRVAVRVPVRVQETAGDSDSWSFFDIFYDAVDGPGSTPEFYREGLRISEAGKNNRTSPGVRAIVVIEDLPLAEMLGDAEGPAHVDWSPSTRRFKGKYSDGKRWIGFVKNAPREVLRLARSAEDDENRDLAADFFNVDQPKPPERPPDKPPDDPPGGEDDTGDDPPTDPPEIDGRKEIRIDELAEGFSVTVLDGFKAKSELQIRVAYDVARGDPLKKWEKFDFEFKNLRLDVVAGEITKVSGNELTVLVDDPGDFHLKVRGFDRERDLVVKADISR